jgi:hypothetical protein
MSIRAKWLAFLTVALVAGPACGGSGGAERSARSVCDVVERIGDASDEGAGSPTEVSAAARRVANGMRDVEQVAPAEIRDSASVLADAWSRALELAEKNDYESTEAFDMAIAPIFAEARVAAAQEAFGTYIEAMCASSSTVSPVTGAPATGSRPTISVPTGQPDWQSGIELARTTLVSGTVLRFVETKDGRNLCFVRESRSGLGVSCSGVPPTGARVAGPSVGPSGSLQDGWHYIVTVPDGIPAGATIRDEDGRPVAFARATDGRFAVTTVPDTRSGSGNSPPARVFEVIGPDGNVIARASFGGAASRTTILEVSSSAGGRVRVLEDRADGQVCVEGAAPLAPSTTPASGPTAQAFTACFGNDAPPVSVPQAMPSTGPGAFSVYYLIYLPSGFASPLTVRDTTGRTFPSVRTSDGGALVIIDPEAGPNPVERTFELLGADGRTVATVEAKRLSPTQAAVRTCLLGQGLVIPETVAPSASARFAPDKAAAAWKVCREVYAATIPASEVDRALVVPDCMAADGWLTVVMRPSSADSAAWNAALQKCSPAPSTSR